MPEGQYYGGELRLVAETVPTKDRPHVFHLPWFPAVRPSLHREFDRQVAVLMQWCRSTLPKDSCVTESDGMQVRLLATADPVVATTIRMRWC